MFSSVPDLLFDRRATALIHQCVRVALDEKVRHQVFEHGTAPGKQATHAFNLCERTGEIEPVILRDIAARDRDQARNARLRSDKVIVVSIEPARLDVIADVKDMPLWVVKKAKMHRLEEGF